MEKMRLMKKLNDYKTALERLREVLDADSELEFIYDATIQRFEFTYELSWKVLKGFLAYSGIADVMTPRDVFKEAFSTGIILEGQEWIKMITDRNLTSHVYDKEKAKEIYEHVKDTYFGLFKTLAEKIEKELVK